MQHSKEQIETIFTKLGGQFMSSMEALEIKLGGIKAFVFDWDGVFNNGVKNIDNPEAEQTEKEFLEKIRQ
jgi:hypothetical protein